MDADEKNSDQPEGSNSKEVESKNVEVGSDVTTGDEGGADYVPDDGENSVDDETTLEEQEAMENDAEIANEVAALQDEQDIPVEELMRLYGYGQAAGTSTSTAPSDRKQQRSQNTNTNSFSSSSSASERVEINTESGIATTTTTTATTFKSHFMPHQEDYISDDEEEYEEEEGRAGGSLNREHGYFSTSDEDSENDYDYVPEEAWKKQIKIGPEYQADVPLTIELPIPDASAEESFAADVVDECQWSPNTAFVDEAAVEQYLKASQQLLKRAQSEMRQSDSLKNLTAAASSETKDHSAADTENAPVGTTATASSAANSGSQTLKRKYDWLAVENDDELFNNQSVRDDEKALKMLYESRYDTKKALDAFKAFLHEKKAKLTAVNDEPNRPWTEEEQDTFEDGLKTLGKNFYMIQQEFLPNRGTKSLVNYYYLWKRTERHDEFVQKVRLEKRQYNLHPDATDYMDHFFDHMAFVGAATSSAATASAFQSAENQQAGQHPTTTHPQNHAYLSLLPSPSSNNRYVLTTTQTHQNGDTVDEVAIVASSTSTTTVSNDSGDALNRDPSIAITNEGGGKV